VHRLYTTELKEEALAIVALERLSDIDTALELGACRFALGITIIRTAGCCESDPFLFDTLETIGRQNHTFPLGIGDLELSVKGAFVQLVTSR